VKSHDHQGLHQSNRLGLRVWQSNFFERQEIQFIQAFHTAFYAQQSIISAHRVCPINRKVFKLQKAIKSTIQSKHQSGWVQLSMSVKEKIASRSSKVRPKRTSIKAYNRLDNQQFLQEW